MIGRMRTQKAIQTAGRPKPVPSRSQPSGRATAAPRRPMDRRDRAGGPAARNRAGRRTRRPPPRRRRRRSNEPDVDRTDRPEGDGHERVPTEEPRRKRKHAQDQRRADGEPQLLARPGDRMVGVDRGGDRGDRQHDDEEGVVGGAVLDRHRRLHQRGQEQPGAPSGRTRRRRRPCRAWSEPRTTR